MCTFHKLIIAPAWACRQRGKMKTILFFLFAILVSCTANEGSSTSIVKSGDKDLDQTANFLLYAVKSTLRKSKNATPSQIVSHITSVAGKSELIPPSETFESSAAAHYSGPRPAPNVMFFGEFDENNFMEKQLVLSAADDKGLIVVEGYKSNDDEDPFFTWKWELSKL